MVAASQPLIPGGGQRAVGSNQQRVKVSGVQTELRTLAQLVAMLDAVPGLEGLQLQEKLVPAYCRTLKRLLVSWTVHRPWGPLLGYVCSWV